MTETNHSEIALQAVLNQSQSVRNINRDIDKIKGQINDIASMAQNHCSKYIASIDNADQYLF